MNVLIVMPLGEFGGGSEQMLYTYLTSRDMEEHVKLHFLFLSNGSLVEETKRHSYPVAVADAGRLRDVGRWFRVQRQIVRLLEDWSVDRILAWMPKAGAYVAVPARLKRIPLNMWRHDIPYHLDRLDRLVLSIGKPRAVACSSEVARQAFLARHADIPCRTIYPAASPLTVDLSKSEEIRQSLCRHAEGPVVGTIARLQPWKRINLFLAACSMLKESCPELRVVVVGGESHGLSRGYSEELKHIGESLLGDSVVFAGEQRNVGDWLQAMDLFVLASEGEPFGIVLLEAMAAGKPVVGCSGGGPEEIIRDGVVGQLLPRDPSPQQMASVMEQLLKPSALAQARIQNPGHVNRFSAQAMAHGIDDWLGQTL